ncbi:G-box-binding factor 4-like [Melia azedarach]|uniref:G-box-binding factor 4-like n=1 Tax=Melia azedarach TaxID=155640 RepID=A0ACC1Y1U8_MELAZ|nr:G-box-binding factor 4-like [Melia azedarach]
MMASSKVMATTSTTNTDLPCQPSICPSLSSMLADFQNQDQNPGDPQALGSMNMDDLLKNIYSTPTPEQVELNGASMTREGGLMFNGSNNNGSNDNKSVDDVWKQIVAGGGDQRRGGAGDEEMTLEDFLTKAGAVREEDVRAYGNNNNNNTNNNENNNSNHNTNDNVVNNNNNNSNNNSNQVVVLGPGGGGGGGRKRRVVEEPPMDKATQQKQRRMIKNRESAARSRERKQAYTVELESLVTQLEEENARLVREELQAEQTKERFKQLMENLIPVVEKRRPPRVLRRVHSVQW